MARKIPNTAFQRWLLRNAACLSGRRNVGKRSLTAYWQACRVPAYMAWLATALHITPQGYDDSHPYWAASKCPKCKSRIWCMCGPDKKRADAIRAALPLPKGTAKKEGVR